MTFGGKISGVVFTGGFGQKPERVGRSCVRGMFIIGARGRGTKAGTGGGGGFEETTHGGRHSLGLSRGESKSQRLAGTPPRTKKASFFSGGLREELEGTIGPGTLPLHFSKTPWLQRVRRRSLLSSENMH